MKKLFKFFILLNAILIPLYAVCPDYPEIPTTSPMLITPATKGMSNFPSSTQQLSVSMSITPGVVCTSSGDKIYVFSTNIGATDYFTMYIDCGGHSVRAESSLFAGIQGYFQAFPSDALGPVNIFMSFDLNAGVITGQVQTDTQNNAKLMIPTFLSNPSFDSSSEFYFCAGKDGASFQDCTISDLVFEYRYYTSSTQYSHLAGTDPELAGLYPLSDGSLAASIGSTGSAYFGDSETNPTAGTSPTWDSSNQFITITSGQFLTFPLPDIFSTIPTVYTSFSFAAWVKIKNLPSTVTTLFAMYSADGTQVGFHLGVKSSLELQLSFGTSIRTIYGETVPSITLNEWQLIGFTAALITLQRWGDGFMFVGTSAVQYNWADVDYDMDLSTASVIRVGDTTDSFSGQVSVSRIMVPGGGFIKTTDLCSSENLIELGAGSFALACPATGSLNTADNECYAKCPSGTSSTSDDTPISLCVPSKPSVTITKEESGLSGGAIAGIVCGSLIFLLFLLFIILAWRRRSSKKKQVAKGVSNIEFANPKTPGPISPIASEANPLVA